MARHQRDKVFILLGAGGQSILTASIRSSEKARSSVVLKAEDQFIVYEYYV